MKIFIYIVIVLSICCSCNKGNDTSINFLTKVRNQAGAKDGEKLVLVFFSQGSCSKCFLKISSNINCALDKIYKDPYSHRKFKILGILKCFREEELNSFRNENYWDFPLIYDSGSAKEVLKLNPDCEVAVYDSNEKLLCYFNRLKDDYCAELYNNLGK